MAGLAALGAVQMLSGAVPDAAFAGADAPGDPFTPADVVKQAEDLSKVEFARPSVSAVPPFDDLSADLYREIRFRQDSTIWRGERLDHEVQPLPFGWIYNTPVDLHLVENGKALRLKSGPRYYTFGAPLEKATEDAPHGFSGLRLLAPLNRADQSEPYAIFQGASYFRAVGREQYFGLSARGLAVNTAQPTGEEFPFFRSYWIMKPKAGGEPLVIHALLDSPSIAGAYRFSVMPGESTVIDVEATLFPRRQLTHVGLAPLTSMFLHGTASRRNGDLRPAVHDSEGLAILNGKGERLWRPLTNPRMLQTSAFVDVDPRGFGLAQRDRSLSSFEDLGSRFERKPTVWVEPKGGWGSGYVELIEIPSEEQIHDNIVVYWKPAKPLEPGQPYPLAYRLTWGADIPVAWTGARVRRTWVGRLKREPEDVQQFMIDFEGAALREAAELPRAELNVSRGTVSNLSVTRHHEIGGARVRFDIAPQGSETIEMRLGLTLADQLVSESWLFRWTQS